MESYRVGKLRHAFAAFRAGYVSPLLELIHPECVVDFERQLAQAGTWHGPEGVVMMVGEWEESWSEVELDPQQFIELGACVIVPVRYSTGGAGASGDADAELTHVYRFRGPLVVEWRIHRDMRDAFALAERSVPAPLPARA